MGSDFGLILNMVMLSGIKELVHCSAALEKLVMGHAGFEMLVIGGQLDLCPVGESGGCGTVFHDEDELGILKHVSFRYVKARLRETTERPRDAV